MQNRITSGGFCMLFDAKVINSYVFVTTNWKVGKISSRSHSVSWHNAGGVTSDSSESWSSGGTGHTVLMLDFTRTNTVPMLQ